MPTLRQRESVTVNLHQQFPILTVCRENLKRLGYEASNVSNAKMQKIADRLAQDHFRPRFSEFLDILAGELGIPKDPDRNEKEAVESKLGDAHEGEIIRKNAEAWNIGWSWVPNGIASKTSKGILVSVINRKTKKVSHQWRGFKC